MTEVSDMTWRDYSSLSGEKILEFSASWCGQCRALAPVLEEIEKEHEDDLKILTCDAESNPELVENFNVKSLPTIICFSDDKVIWQHTGMASKSEILEYIFKQSK